MEKDNDQLYVVLIVGVVAAVGVLVLLIHQMQQSTYSVYESGIVRDSTGQVINYLSACQKAQILNNDPTLGGGFGCVTTYDRNGVGRSELTLPPGYNDMISNSYRGGYGQNPT